MYITNNRQDAYANYTVRGEATLLDWLLANLKESKSKVKATLKNSGIKVNGKFRTQFDYPLHNGDRVSVSKSKKNNTFHSKFLKLVYEDQYLVVIEKNVGILSMAAGLVR